MVFKLGSFLEKQKSPVAAIAANINAANSNGALMLSSFPNLKIPELQVSMPSEKSANKQPVSGRQKLLGRRHESQPDMKTSAFVFSE